MEKKEALLKAIDLIEKATYSLGSAWNTLYQGRNMGLEPVKEIHTDYAHKRDEINHIQVQCYNAIDALQTELEKLEVSKDGTHNTR